MLKSAMLVIPTLAALAVGNATQAQDAVLLRYKFEQGKPAIYQTTTTMKQTQNVMNMKIETDIVNSEVTIRTFQRVDKNKNFEVQSENKSMNIKMKIGPLGEYKYDSKSDSNEKGSALGGALTPLYDSLNGAYLTEVISPRGEVVEARGYEKLVAEALKDNPLASQFSGGGTNKSRRFGLREFYPIMSKKPVKPGDTWEESYEISLPKLGTAKGTRKYKFEAYDKVGKTKTAKITFTTELTFDLELNQGGQKVTGKLSIQKSSGTAQFDPKAGRMVSLKSEYTLAGDISVAVNGMNLTIKTEKSQTVTSVLLDKLPE